MVVRERQSILVQLEFSAEQAWISLPAGESVSRAVLLTSLERARVTFGHLPEAFAEAAIPSARPRRIVVARGLPAVPGSPGLIEHLLDPFQLPALDHFDSVDLAAMVRQRLVRAGDMLARVLPPTEGQSGIDVNGRTLVPPSGRAIDIRRLLGDGVRVGGADGDAVEAAVDGLYHRDATGRVHVHPLLEVDGDVDRDIDSPQPLLIHGDIGDGMRVKSAGDIIVLGSIGDARVSARGCLLVRGAIRPGRQRVKTHANLLAGRIVGRLVKADNVAVLGAIRDAEILASGLVAALEVVGGSVVAAEGLRCELLGAPLGGAVRVEVGRDPLHELHTARAREALPVLSRKAASLRMACNQGARDLDEHPLDDDADGRADRLRQLIDEYRQTIRDLAEVRQVLNQLRMPIDAAIVVTDTARPGVTVVFGALSETLARPLRRPVFAVRDGRITSEPPS